MNKNTAKLKPHEYKHSDCSQKVIACFYTVYNNLGSGFLEKVYENAMMIELQKCGMKVIQQQHINVLYEGVIVGQYIADLVVEERLIVEIKAVRDLVEEHEAQLLNYLKATSYEVGLLLNFGATPQVKRRAFDNDRKRQNQRPS